VQAAIPRQLSLSVTTPTSTIQTPPDLILLLKLSAVKLTTPLLLE
jgi:hypothetical protein